MTVVAIDFGTSNTAIAIFDSDQNNPKTIKFDDISRAFMTAEGEAWLVPSLVYINSIDQNSRKQNRQQEFLFGEQVKSQSPSKGLFQGFKRDIVANFPSPAREIDGYLYDAEAIAEIFLQEIWQSLLLQGIQPTNLIFTIPIGAFDSYLNWLHRLAEKLNFPHFQVIDESTAAALGYGIMRPNALVLVIDFGGGTLDLSLVRTAPIANATQITKAEVIAKSDAYIGGMDVDCWIAEYFLRQIGIRRSQISESTWLSISEFAEKIKIKLSVVQEISESWFDQEKLIYHQLQLNQTELAEILEQNQLLEQLREAIDEVLVIALKRGFSKVEIEQVLLVGGSCQIVAVQQLTISYFGKSKIKFGKPFEAVAHGALSLAQMIAIEDHLRHSYAIRLWEPHLRQYCFYPLFEKGTKYPCQRDEPLILQAAIAGQEEICLDIGEIVDISQAEVSYDQTGKMTSTQLLKQSDFRSLSINNRLHLDHSETCLAKLNPRGEVGCDRLAVFFEIDDRRVLIITVRDLLTDKILLNNQAISKL